MAGKVCKGDTTNPKLKESRAYCEGRAAAVAGALISTNPHADTASADHVAWDAGHASYNGGVGSPEAQDCCADLAYDGVI